MLCTTEYILIKMKMQSIESSCVPILIVTSIVVLSYCYGRIYYEVRKSHKQISPEIQRKLKSFSSIVFKTTLIHVIVFVVTMLPRALYMIATGVTDIQQTTTIKILSMLTLMNSVFDPIAFLVVHRKKLR